MIIFPAIDIKDAKVVRLLQGKFDQITEYNNDPVAVARSWEDKGAQWLHVVDLDGAKTGELKNIDAIIRIAQTLKIPVQTGGGIRRKKDIARLIDEGGLARVILGTKVVEDRTFVEDVAAQWPERIAVSMDCSGGYVARRGWTETSNVRATELADELKGTGVSCIIYTDIARDGMLKGPDIDGLTELLEETDIPVIASGGVANLNDIQQLARLRVGGKSLLGAITGKALYEGKLDLAEAISVAGG